jgi:hypothetical protein
MKTVVRILYGFECPDLVTGNKQCEWNVILGPRIEGKRMCDDGARQYGADQQTIVNQKAMAATGQARMEAPGGVEPPTCGLGNRRSIHLSYGASRGRSIISQRMFARL